MGGMPAEWFGFAVAAMGIAMVAYAQYRIGATREWRSLAEVRGSEISDLRDEVAKLASRVNHLEALLEVLESLKADEIALKVVKGLELSGYLPSQEPTP